MNTESLSQNSNLNNTTNLKLVIDNTNQAKAPAPITIRVVTNPLEKLAVYRFRYEVYIEEMNRKVSSADHTNRLIKDSLDDETCVLVAAFRGNEIVATSAMNFSNQRPLTYCEDLYEYNQFEAIFPKKLAVSTKLMIRSELRKGTLFLKMMRFMYVILLERGVEANLLDCNDHLVEVFKHIGFRHYKPKAVHKDYGSVTPMVMLNTDIAHLRSIRSPLVPVYDEFKSRELNPAALVHAMASLSQNSSFQATA